MKRPKQLTPEHLAWICAEWNKAHPIGSLVEFHPVIGAPAHRLRRTSSGASVLSDHTAVVFLEDESGCVALDACVPVKPEVK